MLEHPVPSVESRYEVALAADTLQADPAQAQAAQALQHLYKVITTRSRTYWFIRLFSAKKKPPRGIYLHGPVGRGKSMLMQLFVDAIKDWTRATGYDRGCRTERRHFHEFMLGLHKQLHQKKISEDRMNNRLAELADSLADKTDILCFDEFHVTDVADAMLLMPYFSRLWERGVVVVATSNVAPVDLYKNGLQRERFLPFIGLLQQQMHIVNVNGPQDYRQVQWKKSAASHDRWLAPLTKDTAHDFDALFQELIGYDAVQADVLDIKDQNRTLTIARASRYIGWLQLDELLGHAIGAADFLTLCARFKVLLLDGLEPFKANENNRAKRFMLLIDTIYEADIEIYVRAAVAPDELYPADGQLSFEFARTVSRLQELRYKKTTN
jgi:cell division protein ZapE